MLCQECRKRSAVVRVTMVVNGQKMEMHMCEECARKKSEIEFLADPSLPLQQLLGGLLSQAEHGQAAQAGTALEEKRCPSCGSTYEQFTQLGRLGCSECYHTFGEELRPMVRRIHGSVIHQGKVPARTGGDLKLKKEITDLRNALQKAVAKEDFEHAARLRDEIKELEKHIAEGAEGGDRPAGQGREGQ
ncbi:MAG: UvrB/UvrC motif-containing protein [Bacillota bacterium]